MSYKGASLNRKGMQLVWKNEWSRAGMTNIITTLTGVTEKIVKKNMMRENFMGISDPFMGNLPHN